MQSDDTLALEVSKLTKRYKEVVAVNEVSFSVRQGELFGFLGPNGAGKTTTINLLTGLARPDAGAIRIAGIDCTHSPKAGQHLVGVVPDESNLYSELTGFDNLCFCAALYGMRKRQRQERAQELLETFGLADAAHRKFATYSKGMKRKLTFAAGIIHRPPILFLDEPTTGIDVASARQVRQIITALHSKGTTVFLTTHYIEEAERLCERIAFIVDGRIVRVDRTAELLQPVKGRNILVLSISSCEPGLFQEIVTAFPEYQVEDTGEGEIKVVEERGIQVTEARRQVPSLEDVFVQVTGIEAGLMRKEKEKVGTEGNQ